MSYNRIVRRDRKRRAGFSLVELLGVIVILGLLSGVVTLSVSGYLSAAKQGIAKTEIAKICQAVESYHSVTGRYPTNEEGIEVLVETSDLFPEGLLERMPIDPWNKPYQYNYPGHNSTFDVISFGADGNPGGDRSDRDISNADLNGASE